MPIGLIVTSDYHTLRALAIDYLLATTVTVPAISFPPAAP